MQPHVGKPNNNPLSSGSLLGCIPNKNGYEEGIITEIQAFIKSFITHFLGGPNMSFACLCWFISG